MSTRLSILFICICFFLNAQKRKNTSLNSFDIYYGYHTNTQNFYNQLNTTDKLQFNTPIRTIGIGTSGNYVLNRDGHFQGHTTYSQVIPQKITVQDSLIGSLTGFIVGLAYGGGFTNKSRTLTLGYYIGANTGRLRIYGNEFLRQKNPFFSPKIGIQPKLRIGAVSITAIVEYAYDLSKPGWRKTNFANDQKVNMSGLRQTGINAQLGMGYILK